jgi:hypothetical protein
VTDQQLQALLAASRGELVWLSTGRFATRPAGARHGHHVGQMVVANLENAGYLSVADQQVALTAAGRRALEALTVCMICERRVNLRTDGMIRQHGRPSCPCEGSGCTPAGTAETAQIRREHALGLR